MGDAMTKEVNGVTTKLALGDVDDQAVLLKSLEVNSRRRCSLCVLHPCWPPRCRRCRQKQNPNRDRQCPSGAGKLEQHSLDQTTF